MRGTFHFPFLRHEQLTADSYSFFFDRSGTEFDFVPGQYVRMILPHPNPDERGTWRYFTVASSPTGAEEVMITTKVIQSTCKKALLDLKLGQEVEMFGPLGKFVLDPKDIKPKVLLAGGIGITPFYSMLHFASDTHVSTPLTLFVSFSRTQDVIFYDDLMEVMDRYPNIKVVYTVTHPEQPDWKGETGRIDTQLIERHVPSLLDPMYFITGSKPFVDGMGEMLSDAGLPEEQVRKEDFPGY